MYPFPAWRRAPFLALLIAILVISYSPATTQGTATVRLAAISSPSAVSHIYVRVSEIQLHVLGVSNSTGWTSIFQKFPVIDLLSTLNQSLSQTMGSATVHSGSYDEARISFTNATLVVNGAREGVSAPSSISLVTPIRVYPSGYGDLLLVVGIDYAAIFTASPALLLVLIRVSST